METTPTPDDFARDLAKDLFDCEDVRPDVINSAAWADVNVPARNRDASHFGRMAVERWPAALRRALAAEALLRRACTAAGPDGYAELTAALDEARALLGLPVRPLAPQASADAPGRPGGCLSNPD